MGWLKVFGGLCATLVSVFLGGWALSTLWGWFVVPLFALPALGYAQAVGLKATVSFVTYHHVHTGQNEPFGAAVGRALLYPPLAVGLGWIITLFL